MAGPSASPVLKLRGAADLPAGDVRREHASWPLASVEVYPDRVKLKSGLLGILAFTEELDATPGELLEIGPAFVDGGTEIRGVGFAHRDGRRFFFWTSRAEQLIAALQEQGFPLNGNLRSGSGR